MLSITYQSLMQRRANFSSDFLAFRVAPPDFPKPPIGSQIPLPTARNDHSAKKSICAIESKIALGMLRNGIGLEMFSGSRSLDFRPAIASSTRPPLQTPLTPSTHVRTRRTRPAQVAKLTSRANRACTAQLRVSRAWSAACEQKHNRCDSWPFIGCLDERP